MRRIGSFELYETVAEIVAPDHTALLVVDVQNDFCDAAGHFARHGRDVSRTAALASGISALRDRARHAGVPVVYTQQLTLRDGGSDSPAWVYFKTRDGKSPEYTLEGSWGAEIVEPLAPAAGETVVVKHRPSAFLGTRLAELLRERGVESVVVAGCLTQGCVQATVTDASYHDFYAVVAEDLVASTSPELHETALRFLRSRYDVVPAAAIGAIWEGAAG